MRGLGFVFLLCVNSVAHGQWVGYWNFDGNTNDLSKFANHGELFDASYDDDVPAELGEGKSLSFEESSQHVLIPADASLNSNIFTLSMFLNDQEQFESGIMRTTSRQSDTFETGLDQHFMTESLAYFGGQGWVTSDVVPDIDAWSHVAYVADGTTMSVYLDGELSFGPEPFDSRPLGFMHIGNRWNNAEGFFGLIDDVAMWNVALPEASVADHAAGVSPLDVETPDSPT